MFATKGSAAVAPATRKDAPASFGVTAVELHEMAASLADIVRMRVDGRTTSAAIRRVVGWTGVGDRPRDWDCASPCAADHLRSVDGSTWIVDPQCSEIGRRN